MQLGYLREKASYGCLNVSGYVAYSIGYEVYMDEADRFFSQENLPKLPVTYPKAKNKWLDVGSGHFYKGRYEDALAAYNQAIQLDPNYANAYRARGYYYYFFNQYEKAIADYDRAIALDPYDYLSKTQREDALKHLPKN